MLTGVRVKKVLQFPDNHKVTFYGEIVDVAPTQGLVFVHWDRHENCNKVYPSDQTVTECISGLQFSSF